MRFDWQPDSRFADGHYSIGGVLAGLGAGAQTYSYALFFMSDAALERLNAAKGFEIDVGPNIVVNPGAGANLSTTTAQRDVYVYGASGQPFHLAASNARAFATGGVSRPSVSRSTR